MQISDYVPLPQADQGCQRAWRPSPLPFPSAGRSSSQKHVPDRASVIQDERRASERRTITCPPMGFLSAPANMAFAPGSLWTWFVRKLSCDTLAMDKRAGKGTYTATLYSSEMRVRRESIWLSLRSRSRNQRGSRAAKKEGALLLALRKLSTAGEVDAGRWG